MQYEDKEAQARISPEIRAGGFLLNRTCGVSSVESFESFSVGLLSELFDEVRSDCDVKSVQKLTYSPSQLLVLHGVSTSCYNMKLCVADHHAFSQSVGLMLLSTCARDADREAMCPFLTVVTRRKR